MDKQRILTHLVKTARDTLNLENSLTQLGYSETPYFNIHGEIMDAIYAMTGEDTDTLEESVAYSAVHDICLTDEQCAEELAAVSDTNSVFKSRVPAHAMDVIADAADQRGISTDAMIKTILSEWAIKQIYISELV